MTLRNVFKVRAIPTIIIINEMGEEIDKIFGYFPPGKFIEKLSFSVNKQSKSTLIK